MRRKEEGGTRNEERRFWPARVLGAACWGPPLLLLALALWLAWPLPSDLLTRDTFHSVRITDRQGGLLRELRSLEDGRSLPLPQGPVPVRVQQAFLAAEDQRFFSHPGVDLRSLAAAVVANLRAGRIRRGGSTITQQLARLVRPHPRDLPGKLREMLWAIRLTLHLDREQILREYLDRVPLGNSAYGVEAAAEFYFGRPAAALSVGQAATLAGLARAPARHDPYRHPERARRRMAEVLRRMVRLGYLTPAEEQVATRTPLDLVPSATAFRAPHFVQQLLAVRAAVGLTSAVLLETTLDPALQADVEQLVREELAGLQDRAVTQAAVLVVDNATGEVLAYVGSADFFDEDAGGQNDGVQALRQPGSGLKPFAYGLGLAAGLTPATVLSDVETHLAIPAGDYVPRNYDRRVRGPVRLRAALANSYNVPAVRLVERLGVARVLGLLRQAGFGSLVQDADHYGVGVVLGNGDVRLWELARAYRGLARGGVLEPLTLLRSAQDARGRTLQVPPELRPHRFLPAAAAALLVDILADEGARVPAFGLDNALRFPFPVAAKTGTSRSWVDNWTVGFTRERTVAVWAGNFDGRPMEGVSGITGAGPLFHRVLRRAMAGLQSGPLYDETRFVAATICPLSGQLAADPCPGVLHERFLPGTEPRERCTVHHRSSRGRTELALGPEYLNWSRREGLALAAGPIGPLRFLEPRPGGEFQLEPGLPPEQQVVPVQAQAPAEVDELELLDERDQVTRLPRPFRLLLPARRGQHRLRLRLPGQPRSRAEVEYRVR